MKYFLILISTIFISFSLFADDLSPEKVPAEVQNAVIKNYKNIRDLSWEKKGKNYEAEFHIGLKEYEVIINEKGRILATYEDMNIDELPDKVKKSLQTSYHNFSVKGVEIFTTGKKGYYKVDLESADSELKVYFNSNGEIITPPTF